MYLDALRGLAIFLVVYCHVASISMGIPEKMGSTNDIISLLHLPLFFSLSGFLMFREDRFLKLRSSCIYLWRKFKELVIPALVFVTLFALWYHRSFDSIIHSQFKGGYWFTFFLFIFVLLYALLSLILRRLSGKVRSSVIFILSVCISFAPTFVDVFFPQLVVESDLLQILSYQNFKYFLFYSFGAWIRSRYDGFCRWSDTHYGRLCIIAVPFLMLILQHFHIQHLHPFIELLFSISSVLFFLAIFRMVAEPIEHSKLGNAAAFIGRRSLDIYFLHFFLLPRLHQIGAFFYESGNRILELFTISMFALIIIAVCLIISWILRRSDYLSCVLFGKKEAQN